MKTKYKFIHFTRISDRWWGCYANKERDVLGVVRDYKPWKQLCFFPQAGCVFSQDCLEDVAHFLSQLKEGVSYDPK